MTLTRKIIPSTLILAGLLLSTCSAQPRKTHLISLPDGYIGWVRIDYNTKGASPLPHRNGRDIHVIPSSGYLRTSSPPPQGVVYQEFQYSNGKTKTVLASQTMIWDDGLGGEIGPKAGSFSQRTFFVGKELQSELSEQVHHPVRRIPLAAFSAWLNGRDLTNRNSPKSNFPRANLVGANFWNSLFKNSNFQKANLTYAAMGADFTGSNFRGAILYRADLSETSLAGADLRDCDLRGALLQGTDLRGAHLQKARMMGAEYDAHTKWPRGLNPRKQGARLSQLVPRQ